MNFDVFAKYGRRWCYVATYDATDSRKACERAAYVHGRKLWAARPADCSGVKLFKYRITNPTLTAAG